MAVRENAFNRLGEDRRFERRDETVFVAFHQHIRMQACPLEHDQFAQFTGGTLVACL